MKKVFFLFLLVFFHSRHCLSKIEVDYKTREIIFIIENPTDRAQLVEEKFKQELHDFILDKIDKGFTDQQILEIFQFQRTYVLNSHTLTSDDLEKIHTKLAIVFREQLEFFKIVRFH